MERKIIILTAKWCRECQELSKFLEENDITYILKDFYLEYYDIDEYPHLINRFNFGGLPSVVILEGDKLVYGFSGILSKEEFIDIINSLDKFNPVKLKELGEDINDFQEISMRDLNNVLNQIERNIDWLNGGFIGNYKLVSPDELDFLIQMYLRRGVEGYYRIVLHTLIKMLQGDMWIDEIGGFSRISLSSDWTKSDKNILSELNSGILKIAVYLNILSRNIILNKIIKRIERAFIKKLFRDGSFIRGVYYINNKYVYDCRSIPSINFKVVSDILEYSLYKMNRQLYLKAYNTVNKIDEIELVNKYKTLYTYVPMLDSLINAYIISGEEDMLESAINIFNEINKLFKDSSSIYRDIPLNSKLIGYQIIRRPLKINSYLSYVLYKIYLITGDEKFRDISLNILRYYSKLYKKYGYSLGMYGKALLMVFEGTPVLEISGLRNIPKDIGKILKPYTIVRWVKDGRYINLIDKDFEIKLL